MASNIRARLPCVSGSEQTIASALLGSQPCAQSEASPLGPRTYIASGEARQINGPVSTTFTGPIEKVDAYFTGPPGVDTHQQALTWLGSTNHSMDHKKAWKSQEPKTGLWFLEGETFRRWRTEPNSLIWLHGGVGCGKTVLCSSIIEKVRNIHALAGSQDDFALCYFYCSFQDGTRMELGTILRLFLASICDQYRATAQLQALYAECHRTFPAEEPSNDQLQTTLFAILEDSTPKSDKLSVNRTSVTASHVPHSPGKETYLFIDALDEIPLPEREYVLEFLQELSSLRLPHLHLLATSRNEPAIEEAMTRPMKWTAVTIDKESVNVDIDRYVSNAIESYPRLRNQPKATKDLISIRLVKAADGMFRWAALQIAAIKRLKPIHPITIEQVLNKLPPDLNETYARILAQINECLLYQASTALKWLALSVRPLYIEELVEACAIHPERIPILDKEDHRLRPSDLMEMLYELISIEPPIPDPSRTPHGIHRVALSHFSVQEFLMDKDIVRPHNELFELSLYDSHLFIARCCLAYLYYYNIDCEGGEQRALREYAWYCWERHVDPRAEHSKNRIRRKAVELYHLLGSEVPSLVFATNWMAENGLRRLKEALNVPFFYKDFHLFTERSNGNAGLYVYEPIEDSFMSLRLLTILPCLDEATEIKCKLHTASLYDSPQYDALSYTWGTTEKGEAIWVEGSPKYVTDNLALVLRRLRQQEMRYSPLLWVDSLCINYDNQIERSQQVSIMGAIFRRAREVIIALGDAAATDELGIDYLVKLATAIANSSVADVVAIISQIDNENGWTAMLGLFERPWWLRRWVIQEVVLAVRATLLFGMHTLNFSVLEQVLMSADMISKVLQVMPSHGTTYELLKSHPGWQSALVISATRRDFHNGLGPTLPQLLWRFRHHVTTIPKDCIYSLLGLSQWDSTHEVTDSEVSLMPRKRNNFPVVDYMGSNNILEQYARHFLEESKHLDILSYCSSSACRGEHVDFPTWVPCFAHHSSIIPLVLGIFDGQDSMALFSAGGPGSVLTYGLHDELSILSLHGYLFDHILMTFPIVSDRLDKLFEFLLKIEPHWSMSCQFGRIGASQVTQSCVEAFWRTILADQWHLGKRVDHENPQDPIILPKSMDEHRNLCQDPALLTHLRFIVGRQLVITKRGYLGLAPEKAHQDDLIAIVPGGAVPYVVRPVLDDSVSQPVRRPRAIARLMRVRPSLRPSRYEFIGESYIHGIMDGEATHLDKLERQTIDLF